MKLYELKTDNEVLYFFIDECEVWIKALKEFGYAVNLKVNNDKEKNLTFISVYVDELVESYYCYHLGDYSGIYTSAKRCNEWLYGLFCAINFDLKKLK